VRSPGFHGKFGHIAESDAHVFFQMAAALAHQAARDAAGAVADGNLVVFLQPVRKLFIGRCLGLSGNGFFNGNDMHAQRRLHPRESSVWLL